MRARATQPPGHRDMPARPPHDGCCMGGGRGPRSDWGGPALLLIATWHGWCRLSAGPGCPRPVHATEAVGGGERGGLAGTPPPPRVPHMVLAEGGPKLFKLQSSWRRRRCSKVLAVSLKHWQGRKGGGPEGGTLPSSYSVQPFGCIPGPRARKAFPCPEDLPKMRLQRYCPTLPPW